MNHKTKSLPSDFTGSGQSAGSGFTLIEVLTALALCSLLMGAVYTASHQYWNLEIEGRGQIAQTLEMLGIIDTVMVDAAAAEWVPTRQFRSAKIMDSMFEMSEIRERVLQYSKTGDLQDIGFWGGSDQFVLTVRNPADRNNHVIPGRQSVWYGLLDEDPVWVPVCRKNGQIARETLAGKPGRLGFGRIVIPVQSQVSEHSDHQAFLHSSQVLGTCIEQCRIRYFDGQKWHQSWDQDQGEIWPVAVEITLFHSDPRRQSGPESLTRQIIHVELSSVQEHRMLLDPGGQP